MYSDNTAITTIPFQAGADLELVTTGGFSPHLLLGISFFDGEAEAAAGAFLNLPTVTVTVAAVSDVNSKCESASNSSTTDKVLDDVFDALTHVNASVDVAMGLLAELEVFPDAKILREGYTTGITLVSTDFPLPTSCISFDRDAKSFVSPTVSSTASPSSKNGAGGKGGSSSGAINRPNRFMVTCAFLALIAASFGLL